MSSDKMGYMASLLDLYSPYNLDIKNQYQCEQDRKVIAIDRLIFDWYIISNWHNNLTYTEISPGSSDF